MPRQVELMADGSSGVTMRLRQELAVAEAVITIQREIHLAGRDPDAVMRIVARTTQQLVGAAGAVVELVEGPDLVYRAAAGTAAASVGLRLRASASLSGLCVQLSQALRSDDTETDPRVDRVACRRVGARSMVVVPLLDGTGCRGVLKVLSPEPQTFDQASETMLDAMASFITAALRQADEYAATYHAAFHDALTGLPNRALLTDRLRMALADAMRQDAPLTAYFIDLDGLKAINDSEGHAAGDRVLMHAAQTLASAVRAADTVARLGGDEFVIVCPHTDREQAHHLRQRLSDVLASADPPIPASIGAATSAGDDDITALLSRADLDMYARKPSTHSARVRRLPSVKEELAPAAIGRSDGDEQDVSASGR